MLPIELIDGSEMVIYPNPTDGLLKVTSLVPTTEGSQLQVTSIEIFDVVGRSVETLRATSLQNGTINISHLENGIYFIRVKTDEGVIIRKVVKN